MYDANVEFLKYQDEIANSPVYEGMPDLRYEDGSIQWEAPSNRSGGQFRDSHDRRLQWWREKAESIGISTRENQWISKTAKAIHPTKVKPCKKCGRYLDIRYCYFSSLLIRRVQSLPFFRGDIDLNYLTNIFDFVPQFIGLYGDHALRILPALLTCKRMPDPPLLRTVEEWQIWLESVYIVAEPSLLSPGAMSNAPDRLDGFHSFNRCCRATADKGRSKQNLALYSTDRRAFEHWVDGNWVAANMLMGLINSNPHLKVEHCLNGEGENHPRPCSADHIGPISLGFAHRPEFQLLCKPCNSAKNNRLYYSDVLNLRRTEANGGIVTSWYMAELWQRLNGNVVDTDTALRFYRILRDNRHNAMMTLSAYAGARHFLFLYTFLNLWYADYNYEIIGFNVDNHIVTAKFKRTPSQLLYVKEQKARRVRVAFSSLVDYSEKENRNGFRVDLKENHMLFGESMAALQAAGAEYHEHNERLIGLLSDEELSEADLREFVSEVPNIVKNKNVAFARQCVLQIMNNIARHLAEKWDDLRYSREPAE
jgi:Alw26I/Eco31I/Esp3I family type II restriction endonuclease